MANDHQTEITKVREDRNKLLVDWTSAILAVFWSVWWIYVADKVLQEQRPFPILGGIGIPAVVVSFVMAAYVAFFSYEYVRWLWLLRKIHYDVHLRIFVQTISRFAVVLASSIGLTYYLKNELSLSDTYSTFGITLTLGWIIVIIAVILNSPSWEAK